MVICRAAFRYLLVLPTVLWTGSAAGDVVQLRGGSTIEGEVTEVSDAGVHVRGGAWEETVSWDRVRWVTGSLQASAADYSAIADTAWRARYRLERGDALMAAPLFEELYARYRGESSQTAYVVAEGVLRCRLALGAELPDLLGPYLQTLRLRRAGLERTAFNDLAPAIDEQTELVPSMPPVLIGEFAPVAADIAELPRGEDAIVDALAEMYLAVQPAREAGSAPSIPGEASEHPGVSIVAALLAAQSASETVRSDARKGLNEFIDRRPDSWLEAWCRYGIGASLIEEDDEERRLQGVIEFLHLHLRFWQEQPGLTRQAGRLAASELETLGYVKYADRVRQDLAELAAQPR